MDAEKGIKGWWKEMRTRLDPETGYLFIEDLSEGADIIDPVGLKVMDEDYEEMEKQVLRMECRVEMLEEQLRNERKKNDQLMVGIGVLYDRLETVKKAHYLEGYADGAWHTGHRSLNENCKQLKNDTAGFPALLESALESLTKLIKSE